MKRTTLMVDASLLEQTRRALEVRTYSEAVNLSLREALRRKKVLELKAMFGTNFWDGDLAAMRRTRRFPTARPGKARP